MFTTLPRVDLKTDAEVKTWILEKIQNEFIGMKHTQHIECILVASACNYIKELEYKRIIKQKPIIVDINNRRELQIKAKERKSYEDDVEISALIALRDWQQNGNLDLQFKNLDFTEYEFECLN